MKTISLRRNRLELKLSFSHLHIAMLGLSFLIFKVEIFVIYLFGVVCSVLLLLVGFFVGGGRFWLVGGRSEIIQMKGCMCWVLIEGKAIVSTQRATAPC